MNIVLGVSGAPITQPDFTKRRSLAKFRVDSDPKPHFLGIIEFNENNDSDWVGMPFWVIQDTAEMHPACFQEKATDNSFFYFAFVKE